MAGNLSDLWNILDGYRGIPQPPVAPADPGGLMDNYPSLFPPDITGGRLLAVPVGAPAAPNVNPRQNAQPSGVILYGTTPVGAPAAMNVDPWQSGQPSGAPLNSPAGAAVPVMAGAQGAPANAPAAVNLPPLPTGVDWDWIKQREGDRTQGYVPAQEDGSPSPKSGVTVAHGFDLGGRTSEDLRQLGLPADLVTTLTPYLGYHGQAAQDYVTSNPLNITPKQQELIDRLVLPSTYNSLADQFNTAANGMQFQDLPQSVQTAITDLAYQYGNLAKRTPLFWNQITNGQWQQAQANLRDFHDSNPSRRKLEAGKMQDAIKSGSLPNPQDPPASQRQN